MPIVDLEALFLDELKGYLLSREAIGDYLARANSVIGEKQTLLECLAGELQKVKSESDRVYELYMQGGLTVDQFKERYQPLDDRKRQIETEMPKAQVELDLLRIDGLSEEMIMAEAVDLGNRWLKMTADERRRIVELLVKTIVVGKDNVEFNLCYLPRIEQLTERQRAV